MLVSWAAHAGRRFRIAVLTFAGERSWKPAGVLLALAVAIGVAACGSDDGGGGEAGENVEVSFLVANSEQGIKPARL